MTYPLDAQSIPLDTDSDFDPNSTDEDDDNDGYSDSIEITEMTDPLDAQSKPLDTDGDFIPDSTDADIDGDDVLNEEDLFPLDITEWADNDKDGIGDNADLDDDNDGYNDDVDALPYLIDEWLDTDGDGFGDDTDHYPNDINCWSDADGDDVNSDGTVGCDQVQVGITDIDLGKIQGHNGFTVEGENIKDRMGSIVSHIGDINKDGFGDYAVVAKSFDIGDNLSVGKIHVFFGSHIKQAANIDFTVDARLNG
ncbi:hypothetical protein [Marinicellulosiphila megalodicopiae]|uniref:hypothetical protein n=1 Tax=Marinicellulosiphila megalodicopiae TaxID=2724896 RepID=UPI003BB0B9F0